MPLELFEKLVENGDVIGYFSPEVAYKTGPKRTEPRQRALVFGKVDPETKKHLPSSVADVVLTEIEFSDIGVPDMVRRVKTSKYLHFPETLIEYAYADPTATVVAFQDNYISGMYEVLFFNEQPPQITAPPKLKLLNSGNEAKQLYSGNHLKLLK